MLPEDGRGPPPRYGDRYDDRRPRGGGGYRNDYRDDYYRRDDRDRGYGGGGGRRDRERDDYGPRGGSDRYGGGRDDRYGSSRGGGGYERYDRGGRDERAPRDAAPSGGYGDPAPREQREPYAGRGYDDSRPRRDYQ